VPDVELDVVTVRIRGEPRLQDVTMAVPAGEFVGVVGGSGSGKTTLLRALAGLERVDPGRIRIGGRDVTTAEPGARNVALVFQEPALLGHLNVRRNVSFPLDVRREQVDEIRRRVDAEARAWHIEDLMLRSPNELSHGEQQMVQIARALVRVPDVLLLDEPFAALDEPLRRRMRAEISVLQAGYGVTTVMSTNDPVDVLQLTTSLAVLDGGRLVQYAPTGDVRREPASVSAAVATGDVSFVETTVVADGTGYWLERDDPTGGEPVRLRGWAPALAAHVGHRVLVGLRAEDVVVHPSGAVPASVDRLVPLPAGGVQCTVGGARVTAVRGDSSVSAGDRVRLRVERFTVFDPRTQAAIA
jgi:ABC-type sugar transport system ATPase subunit